MDRERRLGRHGQRLIERSLGGFECFCASGPPASPRFSSASPSLARVRAKFFIKLGIKLSGSGRSGIRSLSFQGGGYQQEQQPERPRVDHD